MSWSDKEFQWGIESVNRAHVARQHRRICHGAKRGVDLARFDGGDGYARVVDSESHYVEIDFGM